MMQFIYHHELDSTMNEAKRLIQSQEIKEATCIIAQTQSQGRGQHGKSWSSIPGIGLYATIIKPIDNVDAIQKDPAATTLGIAKKIKDTLIKMYPSLEQGLRVKPINDIYYGDSHKLCGILTEVLQNKYLSIGIGLNLKQYNHEIKDSKALPISLEELGMTSLDTKYFCESLS